MELPEWWDESEVQEYIGGLAVKKNYRSRFIKWVEWIEMLPHEQLEKRKEDLKNDDIKVRRFFEEKLKIFGKEIMKEGVKKKTGEQYLVAVRSFFSHHYMPMKFRRGELKLEEIPEVKAAHTPKMVIDNLEFRAIFSVCNPMDKPLLLILGSVGMTPVDVAQLRIESLRIYERDKEGRIKGISKKAVYGEKDREKTSILQQFVLGSEVLFWLEPLLRERGYPEKGSLLITRKGNPYTERSISERIKTLVKRALSEDRAKDFETKNLRDFFHNGLLLAEINDKVIDAMMGWKREGAKQHYKIAEVVIRQAYNKAKKHWSVNSEREQLEKVKRIESQVGKFMLDSQNQIKELQAKNEVQITEIEDLKKQLEEMGPIVKFLYERQKDLKAERRKA